MKFKQYLDNKQMILECDSIITESINALNKIKQIKKISNELDISKIKKMFENIKHFLSQNVSDLSVTKFNTIYIELKNSLNNLVDILTKLAETFTNNYLSPLINSIQKLIKTLETHNNNQFINYKNTVTNVKINKL